MPMSAFTPGPQHMPHRAANISLWALNLVDQSATSMLTPRGWFQAHQKVLSREPGLFGEQ